MKSNLKVVATICVIATTFFIASCDSNSSKHNEVVHEHEHMQEDHVHDYACPMHPEVVGHEGENCHKCGMPLEKINTNAKAGRYKMEFNSSPAAIESGKKVTLSFTPKNIDNSSAPVPLDVEHEKKIHLILVNDDLSWFDHIHPEYQADGSYVVEETFPYGGNYILFADYKPTGSTHQLEKINVNVSGKPAPFSRKRDRKLEATVDDYVVKFVNGKDLKSGDESHIIITIEKDGKQINGNQLEKYLGANAHIVMIDLDSKDYLHVHPEADEYPIHAHTYFEKPGTYAMWVQFQTNGKVHTADFLVNVAEGEITGRTSDHSGHKH